ncbi:MAG TPA: DUF4870 domain-containing protein [Desulfobacterales bacterium]|nr:DUF4870 domain-containing protein [Desulfobacterales bacterium]
MADQEQAGIPLPQPGDISQREKDDAMASYLMMFASWAVGLPLPLVNLIASVVYYAVNRKASKFVAFHSLQSLLSQVPVSLLNAGIVGWGIGLLVKGDAGDGLWPFLGYVFFAVAVNILYLVFSIVALVQANKGRFSYIPFFGRIAFDRHYGAPAVERERPTWVNRPPEGI